MNFFPKMLCIWLFSLSMASIYAEQPNYLVLDTGYRWDHISNWVVIGGHRAPSVDSKQTLKKINSYQLGAKAQYDFCGAFVRGSAHYGWVGGAKYAEGSFKGKTVGHTSDAKVELGYYFCCNPCWSVAPVVGWSWDDFHLKGKNIRTPVEGHVVHLADIKAHQRFQGPFIGFDILFEACCSFYVTLGYELHYVHWRGQRIIEGPEYGNPPFGTTTGFSNVRHMHDIWGHEFKIDTSYLFCDCWEIGLELYYKHYTGDFGHYRRTKTPLIPQYTFAHVNDLEWFTFATMIHIGRMF